jgi:hypothetical protein
MSAAQRESIAKQRKLGKDLYPQLWGPFVLSLQGADVQPAR